MDNEFICNLGKPISRKEIAIEKLESGSWVVLGTPKCSREELNELLGVIYHELKQRGS
jgi:hypothetical protein